MLDYKALGYGFFDDDAVTVPIVLNSKWFISFVL